VLLGLIVLVAAVGGGVWLGRRNSPATTTGPSIGGTSAAPVSSDIVTVPINTAEDPFTPAAGADVAVTPVTVSAPTLVEGGKVGLYGGTTKATVCDREQLVSFLTSSPEKAAAWAGVIGIPVAEIPTFVRGLTPMLLRSDTLVTNHGFVDGRAHRSCRCCGGQRRARRQPRGSGRALLLRQPVDSGADVGAVPDVHRPDVADGNPVSIVVIVTNPVVIDDFTVVDVDTGAATTVPAGSTTAPGDSPAPSTSPTPQTPTPASTTRPAGEEEKVFAIESIAGVSNAPTTPSRFSIEQGLFVTKIGTYHYLNGGIPPGTIGLRSSDGTLYGPWQATGTEGQGGVANAYWTVTPEVMLPPGTYTVVDSSPATWSWAPDTGGRGIVAVYGIWEVQGP
jgi:hypothetical protein